MSRRRLAAPQRHLIPALARPGAYDAFDTSLQHIYEPARRTLTSYEGKLLRLRRASDDAELDFGSAPTGYLDLSAIATWLAGSPGHLITVYDQKGDQDATQATAARQPLYDPNVHNGKPGVDCSGGHHWLQTALITAAQGADTYVVAGHPATTTWRPLFGKRTGSNFDFGPSGGQWQMYSGASLSAGTSAEGVSLFSLRWNGENSIMRQNGALLAQGNAGASGWHSLTIGGRGGITHTSWHGWWSSLIICKPYLADTDRQALESAINAYWELYS